MTSTIARQIANFDANTLSDVALSQATRAIIDTVACAVAGTRESASLAALAYVKQRPSDQGASVWGSSLRVSVEDACFANAVAAHALDYDDVSSPMRGHPSVALVPPLLALAEVYDVSKQEIAVAYALGFEIMVKIARLMISGHYSKGWHATSTLGSIGAAVSCSRLLGLSASKIQNAMGLAIAQSSGTRANFGTDAKSFQAGNCAQAGLRAALLARHGMTSGECLGASFGFSVLFGNNEDLRSIADGFAESSLEIETSGIEIKKYPMCYAAHRALDGVLDLLAEGSINAANVKQAYIESNAGAHAGLIYSCPQTGNQAKFSMEYAIAAALIDGSVNLASFEDDGLVMRPAVLELMKRVQKHENNGAPFPRWTTIRIEQFDGKIYEKRIAHVKGGAEIPLSADELLAKVTDCFVYGGLSPQSATDFFSLSCTSGATWARSFINHVNPQNPAEVLS